MMIKFFQYALTVTLNNQSIKKDLQRISKTKPFVDQQNWKEIKFLSHKKTGMSLKKIIKQ